MCNTVHTWPRLDPATSTTRALPTTNPIAIGQIPTLLVAEEATSLIAPYVLLTVSATLPSPSHFTHACHHPLPAFAPRLLLPGSLHHSYRLAACSPLVSTLRVIRCVFYSQHLITLRPGFTKHFSKTTCCSCCPNLSNESLSLCACADGDPEGPSGCRKVRRLGSPRPATSQAGASRDAGEGQRRMLSYAPAARCLPHLLALPDLRANHIRYLQLDERRPGLRCGGLGQERLARACSSFVVHGYPDKARPRIRRYGD